MWSVVIVAKGLWQYTERCLNSLMQTAEIGEVVYIDNGTPEADASSVVNFRAWADAQKSLRNWQQITVPPRQQPWFNGPITVGDPLATCWNRGVRLTTGERVLILNNDLVFSQEGWLKEFDRWLDNPQCAVVGLAGMSWHGVGFVQGSCFATRKDVFEKIGYFDELLEFSCEEVDWNYRAQLAGYIIHACDHLRDRISHEDGTTRRYYKDAEWWIMYKAHEARLRFCYKWPLLGPVSILD